MLTLRQALQATPWRLLLVIGRRRGLGLSANLHKVELIEPVAQVLLNPANLAAALATLPTSEQQALTEVVLAAGRLPLRYLQPRYGQPLTQTALAKRVQAGPGPRLPLERLLILGLVFYDPATADLVIPSEVLAMLPAPARPAGPVVAALAGPGPVDLACHDLACLLGLLQREAIRPLHGRWLPPRWLRAWGQLGAGPPAVPLAGSERQTGRRRFLHYLAENAGWVSGLSSVVSGPSARGRRRGPGVIDPGHPARPGVSHRTDERPRTTDHGPLTLTPAAWLWLQAGRAERLARLWQTWGDPQPGLWRAYRLPGYAWLAEPVRLLEPLHAALLELDPAEPARFAEMFLVRHLPLLDLVPAGIDDPAAALRETVAHLLAGPLVWLGVLAPESRGVEAQRSEGAEGQRGALSPAPLPPGSPALLRLTPQGLAWLTGQPAPAEAWGYTQFTHQTEFQPDPLQSSLTLRLDGGLPEPLDLVTALELGSQLPEASQPVTAGAEVTYSLHLKLTAISLIQAIHRGWSPPALLDKPQPAVGAALDRPGNRFAAHLGRSRSADDPPAGHAVRKQ